MHLLFVCSYLCYSLSDPVFEDPTIQEYQSMDYTEPIKVNDQIEEVNYISEKDVPLKAYNKDKKVIVGYYADWKSRAMPPENVPFNKLTHINYAFAIIKQDTYEPYFESEYLLPRVVKAAHQNNVRVLLSVGGWTGSKYFTTLSSDATKRATFVNKLVEIVKKFELDGIDIDWEFPGRKGMVCNESSGKDAENFLKLLKLTREEFDKAFTVEHKEITLATRIEPFDGPDAKPLNDVSHFANYVDFINIMAYDINGSWSTTTGPNAPFKHVNGKGYPYSYTQSINSWTKAGFPINKIVMGVAFYGRSFKLNGDFKDQNNIDFYSKFDSTIPQGDSEDALWGDPCPAAPYTFSGVWQWKNLRDQKILTTATSSNGELGWKRVYDKETETPYLYSKEKKLLISYDDPQSLKVKVDYANCNGLKGLMIWALHEDNDELLSTLQPIFKQPDVNAGCNKYKSMFNSIKMSKTTPRISQYSEDERMIGITRHSQGFSRKLGLPNKVFSF